ncbi:MAG: SH3 domain-containing C40 family peptidase [Pyrinomonadaceae bacterium]
MAVEKYRVTATSLNVRKAPSITDKVIGFFQKADVVELISKSGDGYWFKVKGKDCEGWASHKYLELVTKETKEEFSWMPIALAEQGVKEFPGSGDNPRIVEYLKSTTLPAPFNSNDETAWCSCFVNWCVERSGFEGTDSAWARGWLNWGKKLAKPRRGCIVVFKREVNSGHVAFYVGETATHVKVLGGNQSNAVNINNYPKSRLLGYRIAA